MSVKCQFTIDVGLRIEVEMKKNNTKSTTKSTTKLHCINRCVSMQKHPSADNLLTKVTVEELRKAIMSQSNKKSPGPDRIPNELYKYLADCEPFLLVLAEIYSACMAHGLTPQAWGKSNIYLIYKSDDPANPLNYRPISLLNTNYKIFTYLVNKRLNRYIENANGFFNMQGIQGGQDHFHQNLDPHKHY